MTFTASIGALAFAGLVLLTIPYVRSLDWPARIGIAFAGGMLIAAVLMFATSLLHVPWSRPLLIGIVLPAVIIGVVFAMRCGAPAPSPAGAAGSGGATWFLAVIALTAYAALAGRETCGDLLFFWGPKAIHFAIAGAIDLDFLLYPFHFLMHPDYPPLLPLVYAWGATFAGKSFSWFGALALTPLTLLASALAFRGIAARAIGQRNANLFTFLFVSVISFGFAIADIAGAGEPPLLLFEAIAVAALTFAPEDRGAMILASIMTAGAVFTKVEGMPFAIVLVVAYALARRRILPALAMAIPPAALLGAWLLFANHYNMLDAYANRNALHLEMLPRVLRDVAHEARYNAMFLPWIAALAPLLFGISVGRRRLRRRTPPGAAAPHAFPLLVTAGSLAATIFIYLHSSDPGFWIASSAQRVLLTPLMTLSVATAATSE
jgi:hypothetical protein